MDPSGPATAGEQALRRLAAGSDAPMAIVTAAAGGRRSGCLVGFWTQCSIHPPRLLACISKANHTLGVATAAPVLAVHWLAGDDRGLAELSGGETGDEIDKFDRCAWRPGPGRTRPQRGERVGGRPGVGRFDVGDHVGFVVAVEAGAVAGPAAPELGFQAVKGMEPGHKP